MAVGSPQTRASTSISHTSLSAVIHSHSHQSHQLQLHHHHHDVPAMNEAAPGSSSSSLHYDALDRDRQRVVPPDMDASMSSGSESSFSSRASSLSMLSNASSDVHAPLTRRQREQRRLLNRLAVYLPKPLRPIASSPARFITALALSLLSISLVLFAFSSSSTHPHALSLFSSSSSSGAFFPAVFRSSVREDGLPRIVDAVRELDKPAQPHPEHAHRQDLPDTHQPVKRATAEDQIVLHDLPPNPRDKEDSPTSSRSGHRASKQSCSPDGYIRGIDAFKDTEPKVHFKDNLRKDLKYMTFGMMNGFTSQFIALTNGIYLAKLSDRVPILPPFASTLHEDRKEAGYLAFSKIYDVPYLESMLRHPIQDWDNLKISAEQTAGLNEEPNPQFSDGKIRSKALSQIKREKLSCWSLWAAQMPVPGKPAGSAVQNHLGLDIDYWQIPQSFSHPPHDRHVRYWDLVMLDKDINGIKSDHLLNVAQSKRSDAAAKLPPPPNDQLMCFDTLYYTAATGAQEWWQPHAPVWKAVGRYVRFNEDVSNLAECYIRTVLDVDKNARLPEFISVHIRQGTAKRQCKDDKECLPQLDGYKRAVNRIREKILEERGVYVRWVIVTTDETDPVFFGSIEALGWAVVDHAELRTKKSHGLWWEVVLDTAIQSKGSGFVGTERSGMSLVAGKRVEEWNKGPWELVKWGKKGAAI